MIVNKSSVVAAATAFRARFNKGLEGGSASPYVARLANRIDDNADAIDHAWLAAIPGMKKLKGAAEVANLELLHWIVRNEPWHDTIEVKENDIKNDRLGLYGTRFESLGNAAARHPDELAARALLGGFAEKDYTGKNFFDTGKKHFPSAKNTFDNKLTAPLDIESFGEAVALLQTSKIVFPDGSETVLGLGKQLTLIVGPSLRKTGKQILEAEMVAEDGVAVTNVEKGTAKLEVWPELGTSVAWFLIDEGALVKPLVYQVAEPARLNSCTNPEDSYVILNHKYIHQAYGVYNIGYALPQCIVGSTGGA